MIKSLKKIVPTDGRIPVLSTVRVEQTSIGTLRVTGTDLKTGATIDLPSEYNLPVTALVDYAALYRAYSAAGKAPRLRLTPTHLAVGAYNVRVSDLSIDEYPKVQTIDGTRGTVSASALIPALKQALVCVSKEDLREALMGINMTDTLVQAVDGHRIYFVPLETGLQEGTDVILPARAAQYLVARYGKSTEQLSTAYDSKTSMLTIGDMVALTSSAQYPTTSTFRNAAGAEYVVNRKELRSALKMLMVTRDDAVRFSFNDSGALTVSRDGTSVPIQSTYPTSVPARRVTLNPRYVLDALKSSSAPNVTVQVAGHNKCAYYDSHTGIMPMRDGA